MRRITDKSGAKSSARRLSHEQYIYNVADIPSRNIDSNSNGNKEQCSVRVHARQRIDNGPSTQENTGRHDDIAN